MTIKSKMARVRLVEVTHSSNGWHQLMGAGRIEEQSPDINYILREYDRIS